MLSLSQPLYDQASPLKDRILRAGHTILSAGERMPSNDVFHAARYELYEIAAEVHNPIVINALAADPDVQELSRHLFPLSCEAGVHEECSIAETLLNDPEMTFETVYNGYYGGIYEALMNDELAWFVQNTDINMADQSIAYIGGGAMPLPALLLAHHYQCRITIVDPHAPSMQLAQQLIARMGLSHLVDVSVAGGQEFDYTGYTMAWMANWMSDKNAIFRHVQNFPNVHHVVARSAADDTLSFVINDAIMLCAICNSKFKLAYKVPRRTGLSLISLIFQNNPA